ncbi:hypothetical protein BU17DRAFT_70628 [Hysterangium stoloniferum]|nr:hypothetical protein BU17DRAFT_70628 [Hysterangium stoloniferum]
MDFAPILLQLSNLPPQTPEVSVAVNLMIQVISTVVTTKNNAAKLSFLVHAAATHLVVISEYTHDQKNHPPDALKADRVAFVGFLHRLLKVAKQSDTPSSVATIMLYPSRERQIDNLSDQLRNIESSTSVAIGLNASLVMNDLLATVTSRNSEATNLLADMRFLMKSNSSLAWPGRDVMTDDLAGTDLSLFTRSDIRLTRMICPDHSPVPDRAPDYLGVFVRVFEAQCTNGQAVIAKVYEGHGKNQSCERAQKADWLTRTLKYCPKETIEGIYRMFSSGIVDLDPEIGYSQIDISTNKTSKADQKPSEPQPGIDIVCGFFAGSLFWMSDTTTSIEEIVDNDRHMSIEQVGISLFAHQWLGPCRALVQSGVPIALGDIGYMPKSSFGEVGTFQVLGNIHNLLQELPRAPHSVFPYKSRPADAPFCEYKAWNNLPPAEPEVITFEGQPVCKKYTYIDPPVTSAMNWMNCYVWISPREIWKFYSRYVMQFIKDHNLSISPYDLQLVTLANVECSFALYLDDDLVEPFRDEPLYLFETIEEYKIKGSGEPVVTKICRASFSSELDWIQESPWPCYTEKCEGFSLVNYCQDYLIEYYQLPRHKASWTIDDD